MLFSFIGILVNEHGKDQLLGRMVFQKRMEKETICNCKILLLPPNSSNIYPVDVLCPTWSTQNTEQELTQSGAA